jgi:hypothetical protein
MNTRQHRGVALVAGLTASLATAAIALAPPSSARGVEVRSSGTCAGTGTWKLKAKAQDRRIEVDYELDTNRVGQTWRVNLSDSSVVVYDGRSVTRAPSGSFEVERVIVNRPGRDVVRVVATSVRTGATCRGTVVYPA